MKRKGFTQKEVDIKNAMRDLPELAMRVKALETLVGVYSKAWEPQETRLPKGVAYRLPDSLARLEEVASNLKECQQELLGIHHAVMNPMEVKIYPEDTFTLRFVKEFIIRAVHPRT